MASINIILYTSKTLKNGEHPIMLRIIKDRKTKYSSIGKSCSFKLWDVNKNLPTRKHPSYKELSILIEHKKLQAQRKLMTIELDNENDSLEEIKRQITNQRKNVMLLAYIGDVIGDLEAIGKIGNSKVYKDLKRVLKTFLICKDVSLSFVDTAFLKKLEQHFNVLGFKPNTMSVYFRTLRATINKAIKDKFIDKAKNPFNDYSISHLKNETVKRAITQSQIKKIESLMLKDPKQQLAQDYFMFSYYCSGMNFKDFAHLKLSNIEDNGGNAFVIYKRSKTQKLMSIQLVPQVLEIISRYNSYKEEADYIFPVLDRRVHIKPISIDNRIKKVATQVNTHLKTLGEMVDIKSPITTYTSRHTFATTLKRLGQSTSVISNMMGHKTEAITQVYLDSFENEVLYEASLKL
jgi:site-specific recombinase XerD